MIGCWAWTRKTCIICAPESPQTGARLALLADYDPQGASEVGDPYYGAKRVHETLNLMALLCVLLAQEYPEYALLPLVLRG